MFAAPRLESRTVERAVCGLGADGGVVDPAGANFETWRELRFAFPCKIGKPLRKRLVPADGGRPGSSPAERVAGGRDVSEGPFVLEARRMVRTFGPVVALADASLQLRRHEVLGLVGDNGAGKSTLLKILSGVLNPHGGEVFIDGHAVQIRRAQDAMEAGIETVYQDPGQSHSFSRLIRSRGV